MKTLQLPVHLADPPRTNKLRPRRIEVDSERLGPVRATFRLEGVDVGAEVKDLSLFGLALVLDSGETPVFLQGDKIRFLEVCCGERILYQGSASIRRIGAEGDRTVLGLELLGDGLDLAELYREEARRTILQKIQPLAIRLEQQRVVLPEFKAWVADVRTSLEELKEFLDTEERALDGEDRLTREEKLGQYIEALRPWIVQEMTAVRQQMNELVDGFSEDEHSIHKAYVRRHLLPFFSLAPFAARSLDKPLGYAGDYEMMNMLYRDHAEGASLFGKLLNVYVTSEVAAQANINRVPFLGAKIRERLAASSNERVRIANIGCGPAKEIELLLRESPELGRRLDVALLDQEEQSMSYCERVLTPLVRSTGARIQFIREPVRKLLTTRRLKEALGAREMIYSSGLYDYLEDRVAAALTSSLFGALTEGGLLCVGNVAVDNPSRWMMEYFGDWFLIYRDRGDLLRLAEHLQPAPAKVWVDWEPLQVNLFLNLIR
jgi:extracellular factor (EF) 3-hydroxypalmitic acid methyl ester biosynthesis protein